MTLQMIISQAVEKVAQATFSRFSYLPCAYGAARELCRETLATQGFLRICRTCRQIRLKPKRAAIFYSSEVSRQAVNNRAKFYYSLNNKYCCYAFPKKENA